jgi:DNA (cytosine-5)-methyltransferase 1
MRELSLFTGTGGGILGSKLLGWTTVGYVEWEPYCQRVIRQRIEDGIFDNAPIFGDIRAFNGEGYAESYKGVVDIVTGGFPCQPFSVAGDRLAENDPRNMWSETAECLRIIRPWLAFFENVTGLLSSGYFNTIICDLHTLGYNVRCGVLSAGELGAQHKRDRLWILCTDSTIKGLEGKISESWTRKYNRLPAKCDWWNSESGICRIDNGTPNRTHRLKALGNGQVPITMAAAFQALSQGII